MTYEEIKQEIIRFSENNEDSFVRSIEVFVKSAESAILRRARHKQLTLPYTRRRATRKPCDNAMEGNITTFELPSDCVSVISVGWRAPREGEAIDKYVDLKKHRYGYLKELYAFPVNPDPEIRADSNIPQAWAVVDDRIIAVAPSARGRADETIELYYQGRPLSVVSPVSPPAINHPSQWLLDNGSEALIFGALHYAMLYMKDEGSGGEEALTTRYEKVFMGHVNDLMITANDQIGATQEDVASDTMP